MNRVNTQTVNGDKHNGQLEPLYGQIRDRAAALLDAWDDFSVGATLDFIAHLHGISSEQIQQDLYGKPSDIEKRFGVNSTTKLERTLNKCLREINHGTNKALYAVVYNIPFTLLCSLYGKRNIKEVATTFLDDIKSKLNMIDQAYTAKRNNDSTTEYMKLKSSIRSPLHPTENRPILSDSTQRKKQSSNCIESFDGSLSPQRHSTSIFQKRKKSSSSAQSDSYDGNGQSQVINIEKEAHQQPPPKRLKKSYHKTNIFLESHLQMEWTILHTSGRGLNNMNEMGKCKNICYINAIIQCFANIAPFVQWLLTDHVANRCELAMDGQFCSVCTLHSIICDIHRYKNNNGNLSYVPSYTTAEPLAKKIEELSKTFTAGRQQDPSEFLIFLLDHLLTCLIPVESLIDINSLVNPICQIFGLNIQSISRCNICLCESRKENWENILIIPILSHLTLTEALETYFSEEELHSNNLYQCDNCRKKVPATKTLQVIKASPIIFIYLKRFMYDVKLQRTNKIHQFITYPEMLDLSSYLDKTIQELNKENVAISSFIYRLNGVIVHLGEEATSGHVFAYVRSPDGNWCKANDELITSIKLNMVLDDKDAYILCYAKVPKSTMSLSNAESIISPAYSSPFLVSSTSKDSNIVFEKTTNKDTTTNLSKSICLSSDNDLKRDRTNKNLRSAEYSSILNDDILYNDSFTQEHLSPIKLQSLTKNITEFSTSQTESRIEIIPNNNNINKYLKIISGNETFASSTSAHKQLSSPVHQHKQVLSSTSTYHYSNTNDDFNDEIQMMQVDCLNDKEEEIDQISRYSTEAQLKMKIAQFILQINMNKKNSNDLLNLIRGISSLEIPTNCDQLWVDLNAQFFFKTIIYCSSCFRELNHIEQRCINDKCKHSMHKINSELILFDIADEIRSLVMKNYSFIKWYQNNPKYGPSCDILFGDFYRTKSSNNHNRISLILVTDGKSLSGPANASIWPVVATIAEIPYPVREYHENMMLFGLWCSEVKPNPDRLLSSIVHDLLVLRKDGLLIDVGGEGMTRFEVDVLVVGGDLPARAMCNKITSHGGIYACTRCLFSGDKKSKSHHVLYPYKDFQETAPSPRTQQHINRCAAEVRKSKLKNYRSYGVYGKSPLSSIISIPIQSTFDYLHLTLLIHVRFLVNVWKEVMRKPVFKRMNRFLLNIKYPHTVNNPPINFKSVSSWNAAQLRIFLLYVALPFAVRFIPDLYQSHFSLFFIYVRTLRFFKSREDIGDMILYIDEYLSQFPVIFGRCNELYSVHALLHLHEQCYLFGGLAFHSIFAIESVLNHYSKLAQDHTSPGSQIAYFYSINRRLDTVNASLSPEVFSQDFFLDDRLIDLELCTKYNNDFRELFRQKFKEEIPVHVHIFSQYQSGLLLYHSLAYSNKRSSASYRVSVQNDECSFSRCFGEIIFFFEFKKHKFFLFKQMLCSNGSFSSLIRRTCKINSWSARINDFFPLVNSLSSTLCIQSCALLRHKAIFVPFKGVYVCTEVEHELEHD